MRALQPDGIALIASSERTGLAFTAKRSAREVRAGGARSLEKIVFSDGPECAETVAPANFFPLGVGATVVTDADLVDHGARTCDLGGDLGLEAEAIFLDLDFLNHLATENFVASLHVGEVEIGRHVGEQREKFVADHVPEIDDAVGVSAGETGAEDDVGLAVDDGFEEARVFVGVVFEVGVLDDDSVAGGSGDAGSERGAFALIDVVVDYFGDERGDLGAEDFAGAVGRAVIDDDDLHRGYGSGADAIDDGADGLRLVIAGDDDGEFHAEAGEGS